jgi:hypothetical protein
VGEIDAPGLIPQWWDEWKHIAAPAIGTLLALIGACLFALYNREYTQPDRVDPELYGEIRARLGTLDALLPILCSESAPPHCDHSSKLACQASCNEAWARRDFINEQLDGRGSRWVLASGYIDLYRHLHAAEEALYLVQPSSDVVGNAMFDDLRLTGADELPNWKVLQARLRRAVPLASWPGVQLLTAPPAELTAALASLTQEQSADEQALGRVVLRDVRRAINEFRDGERANLVRARNQLARTGTMTAVAGYALLALAILAKAPPEAVISGVVYYVVGAGVGLFNQLRTRSKRR